MQLIFDIETNGFLYDVTKTWCIVAYDLDLEVTHTFDPDEIKEGLELLSKADVLIGHNIVGYDLPVLEKLYGFKFDGIVYDTLVMSRLAYPTMQGHGLKPWGERFKFPKGEYEEFSYYCPEMLEYCIQDVKVTTKVYKHLKTKIKTDTSWFRLEQEVSAIQTKQELYGVAFDYDGAVKLSQKISAEMQEIQDKVAPILGEHTELYETKLKKDGTPNVHGQKRINQGYKYEIKDEKCIVFVTTRITLDDKKLLTDRLLELGWNPAWYTEKGSPQIARKGEPCPNLSHIPGMGDVDIGKYFVLKHRRALLDGMLRHVRDDGRIPSEANTLGAITGRYTHRKVANLPAVRSLYGKEIRALFSAGKGRVQVGCDLAGIEARMLAHFMGDDDYTNEVVNGDIHTANQQAAGLPTRDSAKTFFYGFLYGAGDEKVGSLVNGGREDGARIKRQFLDNLPSLSTLIDEKQSEAAKGYITSLDGRPIKITKTNGRYDTRKALNSLLQSSATVYFKQWMVFTMRAIKFYKLDVQLMISYHDELQFSVLPDHVDKLKIILEKALAHTDKHFNVKCPNAIEIKVGENWYETH